MATNFSDKCNILAELWMNYRKDEEFEDFIEYNDIGLPLAYFIHANIVIPQEEARGFIEETYNLFIAALGLVDKEEYKTLNDLLRDADQG